MLEHHSRSLHPRPTFEFSGRRGARVPGPRKSYARVWSGCGREGRVAPDGLVTIAEPPCLAMSTSSDGRVGGSLRGRCCAREDTSGRVRDRPLLLLRGRVHEGRGTCARGGSHRVGVVSTCKVFCLGIRCTRIPGYPDTRRRRCGGGVERLERSGALRGEHAMSELRLARTALTARRSHGEARSGGSIRL